MFQIFINSIFIYVCTYGYGELFSKKIIKREKILAKKFLIFILGIFTIMFISLVLNFFTPINKTISSIVFIIGSLLFIINKQNYNLLELSLLLLIGLSSTILIYKTNLNNDFSLYHGPFLTILQNEKIIFGLSNLHFRFGHISTQQYYEIIFSNNVLLNSSPLFAIAVIYSAFVLTVAIDLLKDKKTLNRSDIFLFFTFVYFILRHSRFNEFGNDLFPNIIALYYIYLAILFLEKKEKINKYFSFSNFFFILCVLGAIILASKVTLAIFLFIPLYFLLKKKNYFKIILNYKLFIPIFFIVFFLIKNIINTGCFFYPVSKKICLDLSWSEKEVEERAVQSEAWAKDWPNRDTSKFKDYSKDYNENFNWLKYWSKNHLYVVLKNITIFLAPILLALFILNLISISRKRTNPNLDNFYPMLLISLLGVLFWFIKAPLYRYGYAYIVSAVILLILPLTYNTISNHKLKNKKFFYYLLFFLLLFFFISKNLYRIKNNEKNLIIPNLNWENTKIKQDFFILNNYKIRVINDGTCYMGMPICSNFYEIVKKIEVKQINNYIYFLYKNN
jgi:hypothetical protein